MLELALSEDCNLACKYCYCETSRDVARKGLMSEDVARRAIDWLFEAAGDATYLGLTLFGGEPLLNKPVFKFVMDYSDRLAQERGKRIRYVMTTNGTLLDDMAINYIKRHNFGLMVSMDGPGEIHDSQCPFHDGTGSFEAVAAGIKRLMKRRKRVTVRCTMTNARPRMKELIGFFEDFGFSRIVLGCARNPNAASPVDCDSETLEAFAAQEESELIPWVFEEIEQGRIPTWFPYANSIGETLRSQEKRDVQLFRCGACRGTSTVGADGMLYPCHRFVGMSAFAIGHIDDGPNLKSARDFWRQYDGAVRDSCASCWARWICNRPCPWGVARLDGSFQMYKDFECERIRHGLELSAYVHWRIQTQHPEMYETITERALGTRQQPSAVRQRIPEPEPLETDGQR